MWIVTCIAGTPLLGTKASALHIGQRKACPGPMLLLARESCRHCWQKEWRQGRTFGSLKCHSWFLFNRRLGFLYFLYSQEGKTGFLITKGQSSHNEQSSSEAESKINFSLTLVNWGGGYQWRIYDFPERGGTNSWRGVPNYPNHLQHFCRKLHEMKEFGQGVGPWRPLGSATGYIIERCLIRLIEVSLLYSFSLNMTEP